MNLESSQIQLREKLQSKSKSKQIQLGKGTKKIESHLI